MSSDQALFSSPIIAGGNVFDNGRIEIDKRVERTTGYISLSICKALNITLTPLTFTFRNFKKNKKLWRKKC